MGSEKARNVADPINVFLGHLSELSKASALGLIYRDEGYVRPILDVCILWRSPIDLEAPNEDVDHVTKVHDDLALAIHPHLDTFLDFVFADSPAGIIEFRKNLRTWSKDARQARILACLPMNQIAPNKIHTRPHKENKY